jgi:hypothetical protein
MHILLTLTHVLLLPPPPKAGRPPEPISMTAMPVPQRLAFPLGQLAIFKAGDSDFAEVAFTYNMNQSWRTAELFEDVMDAMWKHDGDITSGELIRVPLREKVAVAAAQAFPMPQGTKAGDHIKGPQWGDITPRSISQAVEGDLRIVANEGGFWFECFTRFDQHQAGMSWSRAGVPAEIRGTYMKRETAIEAAKVAGYLRKIVDDGEEGA